MLDGSTAGEEAPLDDTMGPKDDGSPPDGWNPSQDDIKQWSDYKQQFPGNNIFTLNKLSYSFCLDKDNNTSQIGQREKVFAFMKSKKLVDDHNKLFEQGKVGFKMALNHLSDLVSLYIFGKFKMEEISNDYHKYNLTLITMPYICMCI